ncbi:hypothetical protein FB451DRAFT_1477598 [Mycena latifolia]|nr:hypothetical protein FB451DRAFT_1477598 [Mycena latifolia]
MEAGYSLASLRVSVNSILFAIHGGTDRCPRGVQWQAHSAQTIHVSIRTNVGGRWGGRRVSLRQVEECKPSPAAEISEGKTEAQGPTQRLPRGKELTSTAEIANFQNKSQQPVYRTAHQPGKRRGSCVQSARGSSEMRTYGRQSPVRSREGRQRTREPVQYNTTKNVIGEREKRKGVRIRIPGRPARIRTPPSCTGLGNVLYTTGARALVRRIRTTNGKRHAERKRRLDEASERGER